VRVRFFVMVVELEQDTVRSSSCASGRRFS